MQIPKVQKDSQVVSLFAILGSARTKAARRMLMKLTPQSKVLRVNVASVNKEIGEDDDVALLGVDGRGLRQLKLVLIDVVEAHLSACN